MQSKYDQRYAQWQKVDAARNTLIEALDRFKASFESEEHAWAAAEQEYSEELVSLAARDLVMAVNRLHKDDQPVGW